MQKKTMLVTGANGFVGKNLVIELERLGHHVFTFDISDGDITNYSDFPKKVDHVFHLAAKTFIPDSWIDPLNYYRVNMLGTANVLEYCRKINCSLTYMNTYIYGNPDKNPVDEDAIIKPNTPYNHSKYLGEEIVKFYSDFFYIKASSLRVFNVYGKGQSDIFLVPSIVKQVLNEQVKEVRVKTLEPKRDYIYIDDVIQALVLTMRNTRQYSIYNVGSGKSYSVAEVIEHIMDITGVRKTIVVDGQTRQNEVMDVIADIQKIKTELEWYPQVTFFEGITRIVNSMKGK